jgi:hypothetical protein
VLHTWGSALTHHPHLHMIVPGRGVSLDGTHGLQTRLPAVGAGAVVRALACEILVIKDGKIVRPAPPSA